MDFFASIWSLQIQGRIRPGAKDTQVPWRVFAPDLKPVSVHKYDKESGESQTNPITRGTTDPRLYPEEYRRGLLMSEEEAWTLDHSLRGICFRAVLKSLTLAQFKTLLGR